MKKQPLKKNKIYRQSLSNRFIHWSTAISIFLLFFSGFGNMPMFKRYKISELPFMGWTEDFQIMLVIHYLASIVLVFVVFYHIMIHLILKEYDILPKKGDLKASYEIMKAMVTKGEEPPSEKYLAEQRVSYAFMGINILLLVITGMVKMIKNLPTISISSDVMVYVTNLHNLAMFLLLFAVIGHLGAFLVKANRSLLPGMFTGYVDEDYVKHRHSIWYEQINKDEVVK